MPAWNEEEALPGTITELQETVPFVDLVVVNDGSTDNTSAVAPGGGVGVAARGGEAGEPAQRDRHEALPAEVHELVVAETQQGRARPDQQEHEEPYLEE